jgi:hypothetical protein
MPSDVVAFIRDYYNKGEFQSGASTSVLEVLSRTLELDLEWKAWANRHQVPLSRAGRGENSTAAHHARWLKEHYDGMYKTEDTWNKSKALMMALKRYSWTSDWEAMLGELVDFTDGRLCSHACTLNFHAIMNSLSKASSIPDDDKKLLFFEACKLMVPTSDFQFIFMAAQKDKIEWLMTPMDTSVSFAKRQKAAGSAKAKPAAKAPASEAVPSASKAKAKKASKAVKVEMPKEDIRTASTACGGIDDNDEEHEDDTGSSRPLFWVEDLHRAVQSVLDGLEAQGAAPSAAKQVELKCTIYYSALLFCWTGTLEFNGKTFTMWSMLRDAIKQAVLAHHQKSSSASASSASSADDVAKMLKDSLSQARASDAGGAQSDLVAVHGHRIASFVKENPFNCPPKFHVACRSLVPKIWTSIKDVCQSEDLWRDLWAVRKPSRAFQGLTEGRSRDRRNAYHACVLHEACEFDQTAFLFDLYRRASLMQVR